MAARYQIGLNIALPAGWEGQVYYSETYDSNSNHATARSTRTRCPRPWAGPSPRRRAVGHAPAFATWTKPANVPYLNLFCDPTRVPVQLADHAELHHRLSRRFNEKFWINEKGVKADGPLFDLPGGTVKAAVGATYTSYHFIYRHAGQHRRRQPDRSTRSDDPEGRMSGRCSPR